MEEILGPVEMESNEVQELSDKRALFLYPYIQKVKLTGFIEDMLRQPGKE